MGVTNVTAATLLGDAGIVPTIGCSAIAIAPQVADDSNAKVGTGRGNDDHALLSGDNGHDVVSPGFPDDLLSTCLQDHHMVKVAKQVI